MNCPRPESCRCYCSYAMAAAFVLSLVLLAAGASAYVGLAGRLAAIESRPEPAAPDLSAVNARLDSAESHLSDFVKVADRRYKDLGREIHAEAETRHKQDATVLAAVIAIRDELAAERRERKDADARTLHLLAETERRIIGLRDDLKREARRISEAFRSLGELAARIVGLESRPAPERVIVERRAEVPVYYYAVPCWTYR